MLTLDQAVVENLAKEREDYIRRFAAVVIEAEKRVDTLNAEIETVETLISDITILGDANVIKLADADALFGRASRLKVIPIDPETRRLIY